MKTFFQTFKYSACSVLLVLSLCNSALAESEPNNTWQTADTLALNASDLGTMSDSDEVDWWKVIVTADGKLIVNTTADGDLDIDLFLFDVDGTTQIAKFDTSLGIHEATHFDNLAAGIYYVKALRYEGSGNYSIASVFTACPLLADPSTNQTASNATALPLNAESTGHLGYYTAGNTDEDDWWKVTVPADGKLVINSTSDIALDLDMRLYDVDGKTRIATFDTSLGIHEATHFDNLMPGVYYINAYVYKGFGSYHISSSFTPAAQNNDAESNNTFAEAISWDVPGASTGHLGYYKNDQTDKEDWWKVKLAVDGKLIVRTTSDPSLDVDLFIYDADGKTELAAYDTAIGIHEATHVDNLLPGTYYVQVKRAGGGYGSYAISSEFVAAFYANDVEPNDDKSKANLTPFFDTLSGHIGYIGNGKEDGDDWWYFAMPETDTVTIRVETTSTTDMLDMKLFKAPNLEEAYFRSSRPDSYEEIRDELPKGTYYLDIYKYAKGYGSYKLSIVPKTIRLAVQELNLSDLKIYPNPMSSSAIIQFENPVNQSCSITLVDQLGQIVKVVQSGVLSAGAQVFYLDVNDLAKGQYWCRIQNGNSLIVKPIVVAP